jgi:hypothetical protein
MPHKATITVTLRVESSGPLERVDLNKAVARELDIKSGLMRFNKSMGGTQMLAYHIDSEITPAVPTYRVGSVIEYRLGISGATRTVIVTAKIPEIENTGASGFDGKLVDSSDVRSYWGYDHQITKIVKF